MTEMELELARLREENEALKAKQPKAPGITLKVGKAGGVSVYGIGRFPVTLYSSQMEKLLNHADKIREFMAAHKTELKTKE